MNHFRAYEVANLVAVFTSIEDALKQDLDKDALKPYADKLEQSLRYSIAEAVGAGMPNADTILRRVYKAVSANKHDLSRLRGEVSHAKNALLDELQKTKFLYIHPDFSNHVDQKALFGQSVFRAFFEAQSDIREAGNCLAADCNTAAVFHLMRAVEHGLRAIATKLRVQVKDKKSDVPPDCQRR